MRKAPDDIPECTYRSGLGTRICHCHHPQVGKGRAVKYDACRSCEVVSAIPRPKSLSCCHRGGTVESVKLSCCTSIAVQACAIHGECVQGAEAWDTVRGLRARENDSRRAKCCEKCDDNFPIPLSSLAIIAVHFNPLGYIRPVQNYHTWRASLGRFERCLTMVELTFSEESEINSDIVIKGDRYKHLLFQKEPLVNVALRQLPPEIEYVAWLDHDLIFENPNWLAIGAALVREGRADAVQLFDEISYLDSKGKETRRGKGSAGMWIRDRRVGGAPGGAWIAKRSLLDSIGGLYPFNLTGGGDTVVFDALSGSSWDWYYNRVSPALREDQNAWLKQARPFVEKGVAFVEGTVQHLYHGTRENRQYDRRSRILDGFDPRTDVRVTDAGLVEFTGANPILQRDIADYFLSRKEDS